MLLIERQTFFFLCSKNVVLCFRDKNRFSLSGSVLTMSLNSLANEPKSLKNVIIEIQSRCCQIYLAAPQPKSHGSRTFVVLTQLSEHSEPTAPSSGLNKLVDLIILVH